MSDKNIASKIIIIPIYLLLNNNGETRALAIIGDTFGGWGTTLNVKRIISKTKALKIRLFMGICSLITLFINELQTF